jgi:acyl carrier protein
MSSAPDVFTVVRDAVAIVCEVAAVSLTGDTRFDELGADSLARVSIADVIETSLAGDTGSPLHIDDASLGRMTVLRDLVDYVARFESVSTP